MCPSVRLPEDPISGATLARVIGISYHFRIEIIQRVKISPLVFGPKAQLVLWARISSGM